MIRHDIEKYIVILRERLRCISEVSPLHRQYIPTSHAHIDLFYLRGIPVYAVLHECPYEVIIWEFLHPRKPRRIHDIDSRGRCGYSVIEDGEGIILQIVAFICHNYLNDLRYCEVRLYENIPFTSMRISFVAEIRLGISPMNHIGNPFFSTCWFSPSIVILSVALIAVLMTTAVSPSE